MDTITIGKKLKTLPEFNGVYTVEAFKYYSIDISRNYPNSTLFMMDINNLKIFNMQRSKKEVNNSIRGLISEISNILQEYGISNDDYIMGKMGDEIYLTVKGKQLDEIGELTALFDKINVNDLTMSIGASDDFSNGFSSALVLADKESMENKKIKKARSIKKICGDSLPKIAEHITKANLASARINIKHLKEINQEERFKNTFNEAINSISVEDIKPSNSSDSIIQDELTFEKSIGGYIKTAYEALGAGASQEDMDNYILGLLHSRGSTDSSIKSRYFQNMVYVDTYEKIQSNSSNSDGKKNISVLSVGLSGLKKINDSQGHDVGNISISNSIDYLKEVLDGIGVEAFSDIIEKEGESRDLYVVLNSLTDEQKTLIEEDLTRYGEERDDNIPRLSLTCDIQDMDAANLDAQSFIQKLDSLLDISSDITEIKSLYKKIDDVAAMKEVIVKILRQVVEASDVKLFCTSVKDKHTFDTLTNQILQGLDAILKSEKTLDRPVKSNPKNHNR